MNRTLDARARLLLLVLLFVLAAGVAGFMAFHSLHGSSSSEPAPAPVTPAPKHVAAAPVAKPHAKPTKHGAATKTPAHHAPKPAASPNQLPAAVRRALAADQVVVVALYDPKAKIDGTALAEARAGAKLAGSSFVPVDVRGHGVDSLNAKYGAVQDPAVLVLRPPDSLVVRIDGFADRDTVAQAAVNAAQ
ncbi:MAG TPA: hypothetical protein VH816_00255 [Gaiellaceae bacterium]